MPPESHEHRHCLELFERMSDYIDRELDEATHTRLVRHLRECGHCNVCHETLKRTIEICRQAATAEQAALPIDFARRLMAQIEKTPP
jgi:anti-sigma factor RsiW